MNLHDIRDGTRLLVDANILLYASSGLSPECASLIRRVAEGAVEAVITTVTLGELCHRWMIQECKEKGLVSGPNPARSLSERRVAIDRLVEYQSLMMALIHSKFSICTVEPQDFVLALQIQKRWRLLTNDSLQVAVAERLGLVDFVSADAGFEVVKSLTLYKPADIS